MTPPPIIVGSLLKFLIIDQSFDLMTTPLQNHLRGQPTNQPDRQTGNIFPVLVIKFVEETWVSICSMMTSMTEQEATRDS
jgi:hypothetical protein